MSHAHECPVRPPSGRLARGPRHHHLQYKQHAGLHNLWISRQLTALVLAAKAALLVGVALELAAPDL